MDYVYIIDSKLYAYGEVQRYSPLGNIFSTIARDLKKLSRRGKIYITFDVGHSSFREAEQSYYKGDRRKEFLKKSKKDQEAHKEFNKDYLKLIELFKMLDVTVVAVDGVEADDLVSLIALKHKNDKVTILTADRDHLHSVVGTSNVRMYSGREYKFFTHRDVVDKYNTTTRHQFSVLKAIQGDSGDTLKAYRNMGPVKSAAVFADLYADGAEPTDTEIIEYIEKYLEDNPRVVIHENHIEEGRDTVRKVFLSNMKVGATFEDMSNMTEKQIQEYESCLSYKRKAVDVEDFVAKSVELFGYPILLTELSRKVFNI